MAPPDEISEFKFRNDFFTEDQQNALADFVRNDPEQYDLLMKQHGGDLTSYGNWLAGWWRNNAREKTPTPMADADKSILRTIGYNPDNIAAMHPSEYRSSPGGSYGATSTKYTNDQLKAVLDFANSDPEQADLLRSQHKGMLDEYADWLINWWNTNPSAEMSAKDVALFDKLGYEIQQPQETLPFEEAFYRDMMNNYIIPDLNADKYRQMVAANLISSYAPGMQGSRDMINSITAPTLQWRDYLAKYPDVAAAAAAEEAAGGRTQEQFAADHWNQYGYVEGRENPFKTQMLVDEEAQNRVLQASEIAALREQNDATRAALQTQLNELSQGLGNYTAEERAALQSQLSSKLANLDNEMGVLRSTQDQINTERLKNAETQQTAVNLGTQQAIDQTTAKMAEQGYVGGSSGSDAALMRASIAGRQQAAGVMGNARMENVMGSTDVERYGASQGRTISDFGADQNREIDSFGNKGRLDLSNYGANQRFSMDSNLAGGIAKSKTDGANRKFDLFNADTTRRLSALSLPSQALANEFAIRNTADNYGQSGLQRTMKNMQFFNIGTDTAPATQTYLTQPNTVLGDSMQNLGAGLMSYGMSKSNAQQKNNNQISGGGNSSAFSVPTNSFGASSSTLLNG